MATTWDQNSRDERHHSLTKDDQRAPSARDRDRILYSSAFHRLSGVTQIVRAGEEEVFHTRQQHSIKVAQVGRRLAEYCLREFPDQSDTLGIDPEVVEAACLAHDLGHPPFGHAAEETLNNLVEEAGVQDGFEGNAQTFRILTKLAVRHEDCLGLNLTRATLAACIKYPWFRDKTDEDKKNKWSAYTTEQDDFVFARSFHSDSEDKTPEAELMDWADDIAYSVHDIEDFHRCNAIPWHIVLEETSKEKLLSDAKNSWHKPPGNADELLERAMSQLVEIFDIYKSFLVEPFDGTADHRQRLRYITSLLIGRFLQSVTVTDRIELDPVNKCEVMLLKQITRNYIFSSHSLKAQQVGQSTLIKNLFDLISKEAAKDSEFPRFLPTRLKYLWDISYMENQGHNPVPRFTSDSICALTENEIYHLHNRLFGMESGSVMHPIAR